MQQLFAGFPMPIPDAGEGGKRFVTGSFVGNNSGIKTITDLSFEPMNIVIYLSTKYAYTTDVGTVCRIDGNITVAQAVGESVYATDPFTYMGGILTVNLSTFSGLKFTNGKTYRYILTE